MAKYSHEFMGKMGLNFLIPYSVLWSLNVTPYHCYVVTRATGQTPPQQGALNPGHTPQSLLTNRKGKAGYPLPGKQEVRGTANVTYFFSFSKESPQLSSF